MATYTWEFGSENEGLHFTIVFDPDTGKFTVTSLVGSFDLNALWWSNGDVTVDGDTSLSKEDKSLNMNGSNTVWEYDEEGNPIEGSEKIVWDDYQKLSNPGLGEVGEDKDTFISEGESLTFAADDDFIAFLLGLDEEENLILGVRATSVGGEGGDGIKWVDKEPEVSVDEPENQAPEDIILTIDINFAALVQGPNNAAGATTGVAGEEGILIGILSAVDPDAGDTHTFEIVGVNPGGRFVIDGDKLLLADGKAISENDGTFELTIKVTDDGDPPHSYYKTFKFVVAATSHPVGVELEGSHEGGSGTEADPATGADIIFGFRGTDSLNTYDDEGTTILGTGGDDILFGGHANDRLYAGDGDNQLFGGNGGDHLYSGSGANILSGGDGDDTFHFLDATHSTDDSFDTIIDWGSGNNTINVAAIYSGDLEFLEEVDPDALPNTGTGWLGWYEKDGDTYVVADTTGDGDADFMIKLLGIDHTLTDGDFVGAV